MLVKEKLVGLFDKISTDNPSSEIFDFVDSILLDKYYVAMFGDRVLANVAELLDLDTIAKVIADMYLNRWNKTITNYLLSEGLLGDYSEVVTEVNNDLLNNDSTRTDTTQVSAYNEDVFTPKEEQQSVDTGAVVNVRNREMTTKRVKDAKFFQDASDYLNSMNVYQSMIKDVNEMVLSLMITVV